MSEHVNAETLRAFYSCFDNEDYATRVKTFFSPSVGWHVAGEQSSPTPDETTGTPHHRGTAIHTVIPPLTMRRRIRASQQKHEKRWWGGPARIDIT
jgi:hypothetical protein